MTKKRGNTPDRKIQQSESLHQNRNY